jgi:hypothetical protein
MTRKITQTAAVTSMTAADYRKMNAPQTPTQKMQALGRMVKGKMNDTEAAYERHLLSRKLAGEILWYGFEPINIRQADNTFYKPDFFVQLASGQMEIHEVKGFFTDKARAKTKIAAELLPMFPFLICRLIKGKWDINEI